MPKILYIGPCHPDEVSYGSQLRTRQIASCLYDIGDIDIVVSRIGPVELTGRTDLGDRVIRVITLEPERPRTRLERAISYLDKSHLDGDGFCVGSKDRLFVESILDGYDLVWLHYIKTADRFGRWNWPRSVIDVDDLPSAVYAAQRRATRNVIRRADFALRSVALRRREATLGERFSSAVLTKEADSGHLGFHGRSHVVPNGYPPQATRVPRCVADPPRLGFIGTFQYGPNLLGTEWFLGNCWPQIRRAVPAATLRLVGRDGDRVPGHRQSGVDILGWLADTEREMSTWAAMVVPIHTGAGTRVKIVEGLSRRCPIVTTTFGADGYDPIHGHDMYVADEPGAFAAACVRAIRSPVEAAAIAERGWDRFNRNWSWAALATRVESAASDAMRHASV